ncbi:Ribokinase-like protein [Thelephora terrestris]|uniref:ATP-dependent (S)-NAD(P)H-hydrate dehydratase n=1 Tax=Thelephora terrestris TaxID=56493 RepID=A0A9P6HDW0_9AGAM|nr:Ribokinase-like protein [Thelephora terrestris]
MPVSRSLLDSLRKIIPPLDGSLHKGQSGRVGIMGGAQDYTGAPFFAAISALRMGADLSHIICAPSAANAIKSYAPDLIVHPVLHHPSSESFSPECLKSELSSLLSRLHVLVIGPGLGREDYMISHAKMALNLAKENGMYVVLDADALWMLGQDLGILKGYRRAVITPNVMEFKRLSEAVGIDPSTPPDSCASLVSKALGGVTVLQKGPEDVIATNTRGVSPKEAHDISKLPDNVPRERLEEETVTKVDTLGGFKRVGGQGDVLSGCTATWLAWGKCYETGAFGDGSISTTHLPHLAAVGGSIVTRTTSRFAFQKNGRALLTQDLVGEIQRAFLEAFPDSDTPGQKSGKL